jgi:protein-S-isoprenylcysteine O-methyltransferase Ste14
MLKDVLAKAGDFCFDKRGMQYIPYALVILAEYKEFASAKESLPFEVFCFAIVMLGILIRIFTIAYVPEHTSGRNRGTQIAESLNQTGMYSIVRNPLYLGNYFIFLGITAMTQSWEIVIANTVLMLVIYTLIVLREEEFLVGKFGDEYVDFAQRVNCIIPSFKNFVKPSRPFSLKKVIKNEHDTWLTTLFGFIGIELIRGYFEVSTLYLVPLWQCVLGATLLIWFVSKRLKKAGLLNASA